jgi:hypothetical protein
VQAVRSIAPGLSADQTTGNFGQTGWMATGLSGRRDCCRPEVSKDGFGQEYKNFFTA